MAQTASSHHHRMELEGVMTKPQYDNGVLIPERDGYCSCYCGEKHNGETFKVMYGHVYWMKHGKHPEPQSHVATFLTVVREPGKWDVT